MAGFPLKTYGPPVPVPGQITDAQRKTAAQDYIESIMAPLRSELKGITATGDRQAQNAQNIYGALARLQQQQQGSIQKGYSQAAEQQNAFSKGYSDALQQQQQQSVAAPNELLKSIGVPEGQMISPGNIGSLLYGTSGVIPSVSLSKQGAAQGAIQALNPIFARQAGIAQGDLIQSTAAQKYADTLASLNNKIPGLVQKQITDQQNADYKYQVGIANAKTKAEAAEALAVWRKEQNALKKRGLDIQEYSARRQRVGSGGGGLSPSGLSTGLDALTRQVSDLLNQQTVTVGATKNLLVSKKTLINNIYNATKRKAKILGLTPSDHRDTVASLVEAAVGGYKDPSVKKANTKTNSGDTLSDFVPAP